MMQIDARRMGLAATDARDVAFYAEEPRFDILSSCASRGILTSCVTSVPASLRRALFIEIPVRHTTQEPFSIQIRYGNLSSVRRITD